MFFYAKASYAHKGCIYLIKKIQLKHNIVKYYYNLKYLFSINIC